MGVGSSRSPRARAAVAERSGPTAEHDRRALVETTRLPSSLDQIATAIAAYTEHPGPVYVERLEDGWRWSPAHRGGGYPLLRVVARFMRVEYHKVIVPFRTLGDGWAVLNPEMDDPPLMPLATAVLAFDEPTTTELVATRLTETFEP